MAKVAINGLGRVGRQVFKRMFDTFPEPEIVATNRQSQILMRTR
jgi:glyceraldehyde 3-phosphate dehydrogenase